MAQTLLQNDTFSEWLTKINTLVSEYNAFFDSNVIPGSFGYDITNTSGLSVAITGGRVRDGSEIETVADDVITLPASETTIIAIYKRSGDPAEILAYDVGNLPEQFVIPIAIFVTDTDSITSYSDLRTEFNTASGSSTSASGVLLFNKSIDRDITIDDTHNAISVDPTVESGITVTVNPNSVWVIL